MPKYRVYVEATHSEFLGEIDAENEDDACDKIAELTETEAKLHKLQSDGYGIGELIAI